MTGLVALNGCQWESANDSCLDASLKAPRQRCCCSSNAFRDDCKAIVGMCCKTIGRQQDAHKPLTSAACSISCWCRALKILAAEPSARMLAIPFIILASNAGVVVPAGLDPLLHSTRPLCANLAYAVSEQLPGLMANTTANLRERTGKCLPIMHDSLKIWQKLASLP